MFIKKYLAVVSLYYFFIENVFCQLCVKTKMKWLEVPETYLYTYLEAYEKDDCIFWCSDTRIATAVGTRFVEKEVAEQINVCCNGYVEEASDTDQSLHCKPICSPSCINGFCKSPNVCACNPGYLPNIFDSHSCDPLCLKGCEHGTCTAPNTCECEPGYKNVDEICKPICHQQCNNGTCVAPDTCQCLPGYKKSDSNICEPYCDSYSANGECINTMVCEPGWAKISKGSLEVCQPICTEPCVNSTCVAPETCDCLNGYVKIVKNTVCEPYCSSGCPQGRCIGPETCVCEPGWFIKESGRACLPHCDQACGNGTCVAPNVCECFPGYVFDESKLLKEHGSSLCVPVCENCKEACVDPENCVCPWPQQPKRVTAAGLPCDSEDKCERTMCFMTSTTTVMPDDPTSDIDTDTTKSVFRTTETILYESNSDYYESQIDKASWFKWQWFYGIGSALLVSLVIVMVAAILKRKYSRSIESNIFGFKDDKVSAVVHYKQSNTS